jgi:hypothetical protein
LGLCPKYSLKRREKKAGLEKPVSQEASEIDLPSVEIIRAASLSRIVLIKPVAEHWAIFFSLRCNRVLLI